ncbi:MAG TPA: sigma-70 family RNA polymerase sigma factor [Planctomycetota bacterium]|nr:sigma-70 family RNA polymerase sigma factor [Planctomycetota bacterium]
MTPFEAFRKAPTADSLMALLRAHQDGVYTVCLHVLRHPQDAEDAAQEALLKIASGAGDLREPRAFKSWLYRVVYRTAVDHARRRAARRRTEEGSAAMTAAPLSDEQREAIHEAMASLPDDNRLMLVEHYFEKATIEELGLREGISGVAMGKRMEKARERLKRGLASAGFLLGTSQLAQALEAVTPASAPSGLIGSAIVTKAALVAAGGLAVGTKYAVPVAMIIAVLLSFGIGVGGGYLVAARRPDDPTRIQELEARVAKLNRQLTSARASPPGDPGKPPSTRPGSGSPEPPKAEGKKLAATLERYKNLKDRQNAKWKAWSAANPGKGIDPQEMSKDFRELARELEGVRDQIFEDSATFFDFLSRPENQSYVWNLFDVTLARRVGESLMQQSFSDLPAPLADGLLDLLKTGSEAVRHEILGFMRGVTGQPDEFKRQYLAMLSDPNTNLVAMAGRALAFTSPLSAEEFGRLTTVCENSCNRDVRQGIVSSIWWMKTPESQEWLLSTLESGRMPDMDANLAAGLNVQLRSGPSEAFEERVARAVSAALTRPSEEGTYFQLLQMSPWLPSSKWKAHFELAATRGPTSKVREAAAKCLNLIIAGNGDRNSLVTILNEAQVKK